VRLVAALFAAALVVQAPAPRAAAAEPYNLYAVVSLTGQGAFLGKGEESTFRAAEAVINASGGIHGRPVHFVIEDDQTNPAVAVQLFNAIVAKGVPVMFGPSLAGPCYAVQPLVKTQIVNYCLSPALHPTAGSYSFSASASTVDLVSTALRYLHAKGVRKLALLQTTDASGQDGDAVIAEDLKAPEFADMQVVAGEHFAPADLSVDAQIQRIKAAGAQAIISWISGSPFGTVCRGVSGAGLDIPLLSSAGNVSYPQMAQYKAFLPKSTYFISQRFINATLPAPRNVKAAQDQFNRAMQAIGIRPDTLASIAWDPIIVVVEALRKLPEGATAAQVHDYIEQMQNFAGINGLMSYRDGSQRGEAPDSALVVRYDADSVTFVPVSKPGGAPL
jgi:branched-chain amino acid transport system substrate-binding protein